MNNKTHDYYNDHPEQGKRVSHSGQRKRKRSKAPYYIVLVILLGVLVFSATKIISYFKQQADASKIQQNMQDQYTKPKDDNSSGQDQQDSITVDFEKMCSDYPDVVGYIYGANTGLNYPIQYGKGNDYYLKYDSDGNLNNNGSIFIEERNSGAFADDNTIIYGHNMKSGLMFACLRNYHTDKSYYAAHPYIYIYTPSQNYRLDLYAGFVCEHDDEVYTTSLSQSQLEAMAAKSDFKANIGVPTGKTVTLSTCSYEFSDARYVIVGALTAID